MQNNLHQKPRNITSSLSRAFLQKQNTLIIHSKGVYILRALAQALYIQKSHLAILIDFEPVQIQEINYYIQEIKHERMLLCDDIRNDKPEVYSLAKTQKQKRRKAYISGGIYALTTQIALLDCLSDSQDLDPKYISRVVLKDQDTQITDKFSLTSWLATLLRLNGNNTIITVASRRAHKFRGEKLEKIMRLLYINKLVLWPFGRSQIDQSIRGRSLKNKNHKLSMDMSEQQIHRCYLQLLRYCQRSQHQRQRENIEYIVYSLLNHNKLEHLRRLQCRLQNCGEYSIWKSNNSNIMELIDKILNISKNCVFSLYLKEDTKKQNDSQLRNQDINLKGDTQNGVPEGRTIDLSKLLQENYQSKDKSKENINFNPLIHPISKSFQGINESNSIQSALMTNLKSNQFFQSTPYHLCYQLHVPGLISHSLQSFALFPVKLRQLIKQMQNYVTQKQQIFGTDDQNIQMIQFISSLRCKSQQTNKQNIQKEIIQEQKINEKQKALSQPNNNEQQQQKKQQSSQKLQADLSKYQFTNISNYIPQQNCQEKLTKINKPNQQQAQNENKQQEQPSKNCELSNINQHQVKNGEMITNEVPKIWTFVNEQTVYVCTNDKEISKQLHYYIHCYQQKVYYLAYLKELYAYLDSTKENRANSIKKLIKKIKNPNGNNKNINKKTLMQEQQPILIQQLYLQLKKLISFIEKFTLNKHERLQRNYLFQKELNMLQLRYIDRNLIHLPTKDYNPLDDCILTFFNKRGSEVKIRFCLQINQSISELNQNLRVLSPSNVFFYSPNTSFIRHLNIMHSQDLLVGVQNVHAIYFNNSLESEKVVKAVKEEDEAFWVIAEERKKLGQYKQNPEARIRQLMIEDQIQKKAKMLSLASSTQLKSSQFGSQFNNISRFNNFTVERTILVDKRQFKSLLPSYLFYHGFKIVPVFLENADYIISNEIGIQKKSVQTRDLHESLRTGRLYEQIKRMCSKFAKPYLLIECPDTSQFKKEEFSYSYSKITGDKYSFNVRKKLIELINKFPKINVIWSTSYMQTVKYFIQLKKNQEEPDVMKFKPQSEQNQIEVLNQIEEGIKENQDQQ